MLLWTTLKIALNSLTMNKLRSILTMLGVIIGVGAVIAMLSLGSAFGKYISGQVMSMGSNVLFVRAGQGHMGPGGGLSQIQNLKPEDAEAMLAIDGVKSVSPMTFGNAAIKAGNKATNTASVQGMAPSLPIIQNIELDYGRWFNDADVRRSTNVAVLGAKTAKDLFPQGDAIDKTIRVRSVPLRVIGVTKPKGDVGGFNPDDRVLLPYSTAMKKLPPHRDYVQMITVEVSSQAQIPSVIDNIKQLLRKRHRLSTDAEDDFTIQNMTEVLEALGKVTTGLTLFLAVVAAISLIVGGIGIMNIMLATVAERTREIGIRKAIGAKGFDILRQFLIEALVITLGGGLLGLALGYGLMKVGNLIVSQWLKLDLQMQWWVVVMSIAISTAVGLISGLYPALRASRLDPVEALRYE